MEHKKLRINKIEAARRQIDTAIWLFFSENPDPISIHTLASAGYDLLKDVGSARGLDVEPGLKSLKPEWQGRVRRRLKEPQNFFKHADMDHTAIHDFKPKLSWMFLWDVCLLHQALEGLISHNMQIFLSWFYALHKDELHEIFLSEKDAEQVFAIVKVLDPGDRASFRKHVRPCSSTTTMW